MASSSSFSSSAPTFSSESWKYDVFLSFRGEDTRKTFVDHLYTALEQKGIYTYKDDESLPRGASIGSSSMTAIEESQFAIVVFSKNYADSSWCLDELACIMKCKDTRGQIVLPIYYNVEPSEVRKQKRTYGEAFVKHELENNKKVESWRKALVDVSNLSGWETKHIANGHESKAIKEIVETISKMLGRATLNANEDSSITEDNTQYLKSKVQTRSDRVSMVRISGAGGGGKSTIASSVYDTISTRLERVTSSANEDLVGIEARVRELKSKLKIGTGGVSIIGIWGVGGSGKTTLASSVYDEIYDKFDGFCFLENIREESSKNGLEKLQEKIVSRVLKQKQVLVRRVEEGRRMIMSRLCSRKVLIVLDDVNHLDQLEALAGSHDWFGEGSRMIVTTRDKYLLVARKVNVIHDIYLLDNDEALKLFRKHALLDRSATEAYEQLSKDVVSYAGGLPLALRVLGRFLCDKEINEWRSAMARLKEIPDDEILEKLKISFDGLLPDEKDVFLDIACFFRGEDKDKAMIILDACGFHPVIRVEVLIQKALITISDGRFDMHDLVQEMGHHIVRGELPNNPEKHSRIWKEEDVLKICAMDATTELDKIEAIQFEYNMDDRLRLPPIVANMKNLRWIDWDCDLASPLPVNFPPRELCFLKLDGISQKQLWEGYKYLPNLSALELYGLRNLIKTPHFDGLPNLERFKLSGCWYLGEIHPSIGRLERLVILSIEFCVSFEIFPPITQLKRLKSLTFSRCPKLFKRSKIQHHMNHIWLRELDLSYCDLVDESLGTAVWELPNMQKLNLTANKFSRLDFSLLRLPRLKWLNISSCQRLVELSELPSSIAVLITDGCTSLDTFGDVSNCKWLWNVSHRRGNKLIGDILLLSMLQGHAVEDHFISLAVEHQNPEGFVSRLFRAKTFTLHLPDDWYNDFCGFLICFVTNMKSPHITIIIEQHVDKDNSPFEDWEESNEALESEYDGTTTFVGYVSFGSLRHTSLLNLSYETISFSIEDRFSGLNAVESYVGAELIPRKSRGDKVQAIEGTTEYSEFWDEEHKHGNTFTIDDNSKSSIKIQWFP